MAIGEERWKNKEKPKNEIGKTKKIFAATDVASVFSNLLEHSIHTLHWKTRII